MWTNAMRCSACGARCDPNRSFCRRCGSAVFVDDGTFDTMRRTAAALRSEVDEPRVARVPRRIPQTLQRTARQARRPGSTQTVAAGAGCLAGLARWVFFVGLLYFVLVSLEIWPAIRDMADAAMRGEQVDVLPAVNRVRALADLPPIERIPQSDQASPTAGAAPDSGPAPAVPVPQQRGPAESALIPPRIVRQVPPRYPADAFERGIQGVVAVRARVEPDGTVSEATVTQSVAGLDAAAVAAVRQWRFEPARRGGQPVASDTTVTLTFRR